MKRSIQTLLAGAACALYTAAGVAAFAQPETGAAGPPPGRGGPMMGGRMRAPETPAERAARLRDVLQLRPAQEPALQTFANALEAARQSMTSASAGPWPQTTPERVARMQQMMSQHQTAMTAVGDATLRFYDQLDPAQKRAFDAMGPQVLMGGRGGRGGMGGPGMMGPPPGPPPER